MGFLKFLGGIILACALIAGTSYARIQVGADKAARQNDITVAAYYRFGVIPDSIVYDLWQVGGKESPASIMGSFMRFAQEMKDREFREIHMAWRGQSRFILDGDDFAEIGRDLDRQNPLYTLRTFPQKLRKPDGTKAFSTWTGGLIGVTGAQMNDMNDMAHQWYLDEILYPL